MALGLFTFILGFSQEKKGFEWNRNSQNDNVIMTWNKDTPEQEMKDDIKVLGERGVTIKYSNVKRNSNNEIIAIRMEYSDRKGNKGSMELNNQKPINTIKFFKQGNQIGFGEPSGSDAMMAGNPFFHNFSGNGFMKQFNFGEGNGDMQSFDFTFPDGKNGESKSKIIIKKDGKKPLVIEDGNVVEGGEDYAPEEIEEIKKNNKTEIFEGDEMPRFKFNSERGSFENLSEQMKKMQEQIDRLMKENKIEDSEKLPEEKPKSNDKKENKSSSEKEPVKSKPSLKTQKI